MVYIFSTRVREDLILFCEHSNGIVFKRYYHLIILSIVLVYSILRYRYWNRNNVTPRNSKRKDIRISNYFLVQFAPLSRNLRDEKTRELIIWYFRYTFGTYYTVRHYFVFNGFIFTLCILVNISFLSIYLSLTLFLSKWYWLFFIMDVITLFIYNTIIPVVGRYFVIIKSLYFQDSTATKCRPITRTN